MSHPAQRNPVQRLFDVRLRGFRMVELVAAIVLVATIGFVYIAKTGAAEQADQIAQLESEVRVNQQRVRLLRAEVASLERPERIEALSEAAGLSPVTPDRQTAEARLGELASSRGDEAVTPDGEPLTALVATAPPDGANPATRADREGAQ
ncbi:MAG: cell division protein [Brevundimonas sp.]|nr:MAG: cell division protein [Brevundimonas sp.]